MPSASWLAEYDRLLQRHQVLRNGNVNQLLNQSEWEVFADELMTLLGQV